MPKISVIVPVYKVEAYLNRCVDSILAQTFTDFEIILVDDGSPDGCPVICDEYAQKDARIHVIHQENGGLSAARNAGIDWSIAHSDSKWLSFVDSDDWIHPCFLEFLYRAAVENNVEVSSCAFAFVSEERPMSCERVEYQSKLFDFLSFYTEPQYRGFVDSSCNKLFSKKLFGEYRYPLGKLYEDSFLTCKLLYVSSKIAFVQDPLYQYFSREGSITNATFSESNLDAIEAINEQCDFFKQKNEQAYAMSYGLKLYIVNCYAKLTKKDKRYKKQAKALKKELRRMILKNDSQRKTSIWRDYDFYRTAFPIVARFAFPFIAVWNKLSK